MNISFKRVSADTANTHRPPARPLAVFPIHIKLLQNRIKGNNNEYRAKNGADLNNNTRFVSKGRKLFIYKWIV